MGKHRKNRTTTGYVKLFRFPVLYEGWETDNSGWVAERPDGSRCLIMTSHGAEYEADPKELEERITLYKQALEDSEKALQMLHPTTRPGTNERPESASCWAWSRSSPPAWSGTSRTAPRS